MAFFTTQDDTEIFYNDAGRGSPVILIHGWPATSEMFEYQTTALLERGHRVITYDRRGFGKSGKPAGGYDYDTLAADLQGLIEHLELEEVALVGFSMGGGEIARYLGRYGAEKITRVALVSSVVPYMLLTEANPHGVKQEAFDGMIEGLREDRPKFLGGWAKDFYGVGMVSSPVSEEVLGWTAYMTYQASLKATIDCVTAFASTDFRPDLAAFTVPTLVVHGTADKIVPIAATGREVAKAVHGAISKFYEGAPHGLFVTHKKELNADLLSFLESDARRTRTRATEIDTNPIIM